MTSNNAVTILESLVGQVITFIPQDRIREDRPMQTVRILSYQPDAVISATENGPAFNVSITYKNKRESIIEVTRTLSVKRFGEYLAQAAGQPEYDHLVKPEPAPKAEKAAKSTEEQPVETPAEFVTENVLTDRQPNRKERKAAKKAAAALNVEDVPEDLTSVPAEELLEEAA